MGKTYLTYWRWLMCLMVLAAFGTSGVSSALAMVAAEVLEVPAPSMNDAGQVLASENGNFPGAPVHTTELVVAEATQAIDLSEIGHDTVRQNRWLILSPVSHIEMELRQRLAVLCVPSVAGDQHEGLLHAIVVSIALPPEFVPAAES